MISKNQKKTQKGGLGLGKFFGKKKVAPITHDKNNIDVSYQKIKKALAINLPINNSNLIKIQNNKYHGPLKFESKQGYSGLNNEKNKKNYKQIVYNFSLKKKELLQKKPKSTIFGKKTLNNTIKKEIHEVVIAEAVQSPVSTNSKKILPRNRLPETNLERPPEILRDLKPFESPKNEQLQLSYPKSKPFNLRMCIASKANFEEILSFLEIAGLDKIFDTIYTALEEKENKHLHRLNNDLSYYIPPKIGEFNKSKPIFIKEEIKEFYSETTKPFMIYVDDNPEIMTIEEASTQPQKIKDGTLLYGTYENLTSTLPFNFKKNNNKQLDFLRIKLQNGLSGLNMNNETPQTAAEVEAYKVMILINDIVNKCKLVNRDVIIVFDFDCTITKKHLTFSLGSAKGPGKDFNEEFIQFLISLDESVETELETALPLETVTSKTPEEYKLKNISKIYEENFAKRPEFHEELKNYFISKIVIDFMINLRGLSTLSSELPPPRPPKSRAFQPKSLNLPGRVINNEHLLSQQQLVSPANSLQSLKPISLSGPHVKKRIDSMGRAIATNGELIFGTRNRH